MQKVIPACSCVYLRPIEFIMTVQLKGHVTSNRLLNNSFYVSKQQTHHKTCVGMSRTVYRPEKVLDSVTATPKTYDACTIKRAQP